MLGEHGVPAFITRLRNLISQVSLERLEALQTLVPVKSFPGDLLANYFGGAVIGVLDWWLENNMIMSPEEVAHYTLQLTVSGLYTSIGLDNPFSQ
jgi:hypothetical protein